MKEIYLCGTQHLSLEGPNRLRKVLKKIKPEIIAIELDKKLYKETVKNHQKYVRFVKEDKFDFTALSKKINKKTAKKFFISVGYEGWVLKEYSKKNRVKIIFLENKKTINKIISKYSDSFEYLKKYLELSPKKFQITLDNYRKGKDNDTLSIERNKIFARKIKKLKGKILVIVGIDHIKGHKPNLQTLLKENKPKIINLLKKI